MKIRALLFSADEVIRTLISNVLRQRQYEVYDFAKAGSCPLSLVEECPRPEGYACGDFVITQTAGQEFIEERINHGCKVKNFAVMSGWWSDAEQEKAKELGCKILEKPYVFDELNLWLDECEQLIKADRKLWDWFSPIG